MEHEYIKEALSHYNIAESEAVLLRHNENMTFRVGTALQKVQNKFLALHAGS